MSDPQHQTTGTGPDLDGTELHHDFDGIRELDNDPPLWFNLLFWGTLVWAIGYALHYHWGPGKLGGDKWKAEMVQLNELKAKNATGPLTEAQLRPLSTNAERIAAGKALYGKVGCAACHGAEGAGLIGPNLRDKYWIYGSNMTEIYDVIANGRGNGTMPAQKNALSSDDMNNLTIYIISLNRAGAIPGKAIDPAREKDNPVNY